MTLETGCGVGDPGGNRTRDNLIKSPTGLPIKMALSLIFREFHTKKYNAIIRHILGVTGITRHNLAKVIGGGKQLNGPDNNRRNI